MTQGTSQRPADAAPDNWVDRYAPMGVQPYLRLLRMDRPVGVWLLLWPCWWSVALATNLLSPDAAIDADGVLIPDPMLLLLFAVGAFVMRGAGCIVNDIWDRKIDAQVTRTARRPIASGAISVRQAVLLLITMLLLGLMVLLQLGETAILLGMLSLPLVAIYPLAKRVVWWPQLVLGIVFNWGALMGWTAVSQAWPTLPSLLLYLGCMFWTLGYDTIYAHQDKEDDALVGVKSTALKFGRASRQMIALFYALALIAWGVMGWQAQFGLGFWILLAFANLHFFWQVTRLNIDDPDNCLHLFKSNISFGWILLAAMVIG